LLHIKNIDQAEYPYNANRDKQWLPHFRLVNFSQSAEKKENAKADQGRARPIDHQLVHTLEGDKEETTPFFIFFLFAVMYEHIQ
jgi:hypothetical protein